MTSAIITVCSAFVGVAGLGYVVQGLRQGYRTKEGREKIDQGAFLVLMIGSHVLPESLGTVREGLVIAGCLLLLYMILRRRRAEMDASRATG